MEKFRLFTFEGMADELKNPSQDEQPNRNFPKRMEEKAGDQHRTGTHDERNAESMAEPVHRMLMAGSILRDPLLVGLST